MIQVENTLICITIDSYLGKSYIYDIITKLHAVYHTENGSC